ncbi:MAG TPA: diaminopimelate epimerase, partial [Spirochaetota bacterium]
MIPFTKMHGTGNDYIYVNAIDYPVADPEKLSIAMSDRHFGIGSDGLILILPSVVGDYRMRMFNSDGSESEMCGNGIRCFAKYLYDHHLTEKSIISIETGAGVKRISLTIQDRKAVSARVDMGTPEFERGKIPMKGNPGRVLNEEVKLADGTTVILSAVSMGNPHAVVFVDDVKKYPVEKIGPMIENSPFFPRRTNVEFVTVVSPREVIQRTW